jgi:sporulation protein YqfD
VKKHGLPNFVSLHKYRLGAFFGILAVALIIACMSTLIWRVEIVSKDGVKINNFTETVEEIGVKIGARKSKIDIVQVQQQLLDAFPELSWVSLNIFGSKAQIEYSYARKALPIVDEKISTNVVASKNGEIVLVDGNIGENKVKVGENVAEGTLLISGIIVNSDGTERLVHARGKVFARTNNKHVVSSRSMEEVFILTESKAVYEPMFFGITLAFQNVEGDLNSKTCTYLSGNGEQLPLGIARVDCITAQRQKVKISEQQQILNALYSAVEIKRKQYVEARLEKVNYSYTIDSDKVELTSQITCIENIALEKAIEVE